MNSEDYLPSKMTDFDEWVCMLDCNIGSDQMMQFTLYLAETYLSSEDRLNLMRSLLEMNEENQDAG